MRQTGLKVATAEIGCVGGWYQKSQNHGEWRKMYAPQEGNIYIYFTYMHIYISEIVHAA